MEQKEQDDKQNNEQNRYSALDLFDDNKKEIILQTIGLREYFEGKIKYEMFLKNIKFWKEKLRLRGIDDKDFEILDNILYCDTLVNTLIEKIKLNKKEGKDTLIYLRRTILPKRLIITIEINDDKLQIIEKIRKALEVSNFNVKNIEVIGKDSNKENKIELADAKFLRESYDMRAKDYGEGYLNEYSEHGYKRDRNKVIDANVYRIIEEYQEGKQHEENKRRAYTLLDVGCGDGARYLVNKKEYPDVYESIVPDGMDISKNMIEIAKSRKIYKNLMIDDVRIAKLPIEKYDIVISLFGVFSHLLQEEEKAFSNIEKCVKKGGIFVFDVFGMQSLPPKGSDQGDYNDKISRMLANKAYSEKKITKEIYENEKIVFYYNPDFKEGFGKKKEDGACALRVFDFEEIKKITEKYFTDVVILYNRLPDFREIRLCKDNKPKAYSYLVIARKK